MTKRNTLELALAVGAMVLLAMPVTAADQLPGPDGKPADMSQPVQVYILMGQSNMLGFGKINPSRGKAEGSLTHAVKEKKKYPYTTWAHPDRCSISIPSRRLMTGGWMTCARSSGGMRIDA
jgi:hypothetical protein